MPVTFKQATLENGLTIIAEVDPDALTAAAGFFVRTGARDETSKLMGVSHFLEHMMFKGTDTISADDLNRRFDEMGARNNAYTSSEMTCFWAHVLPERLADATELLSAMMRPALRQDDFDMEKHVILEEIAMYRDNPFWVLYERMMEEHYKGHTLAHRVLGTDETITDMERNAMLGYFDDRYSADNTVVSLAGNVDFEHAAGLIEDACGNWQNTGADRDTSRPACQRDTVVIEDESINRAYLIGLSPAPSFSDERRYAAAALAQVLGAPDNSRLHWSLVETGLAEEAQAAYDPHDGVGDYFVYASGDPDRIDEIEGAIGRDIEALVDSVTGGDLARLCNRMATAATLGAERPADRMQRLGRQWTYTGEYSTLEDELERIENVTVDDVRALAEEFPIAMTTVGRLVPA